MRRSLKVQLLLGFVVFAIVLAGTHTNAASANVSTSYKTTSAISAGSLVSLDPSQSGYIQPANTSNGTRLLGVAVNSSDSLIALDPTSGQVQVASTGSAQALVSTVNGTVNVGDQISVSPFDGVGMKADSSSYIVGIAQTGINQATSGAKTETVTDKSGHQVRIVVGYIRVNIGVRGPAVGTSGNKNGLQQLAKGLTGHYVSTVRVAVSIGISVLALVAIISLTYSAIYGSIVSVGRNPLAKFTIFRTLSSVLVFAGLTVLLAGGTIFLLLR